MLTEMNLTEIVAEIEAHETQAHVASLFVLLGIFAVYLWIVLSFGPEFMKQRDPFDVTILLRAYNIFQVISCLLYIIGSYQLGFTFENFLRCERFDFLTKRDRLIITIGAWLFLMLRTFEFVETIFFVARKKRNQISFLHIFHHIGSVIMTWLFIVSRAELMAVYIVMLNSFVHVIMYSYYFLSSYKSSRLQKAAKSVKPFITLVQLVQFVIIIAECVIAVLPKCNLSFFFHIQIINFAVLFVLFGRFFVLNYFKNEEVES